jgi:hypothetical protein
MWQLRWSSASKMGTRSGSTAAIRWGRRWNGAADPPHARAQDQSAPGSHDLSVSSSISVLCVRLLLLRLTILRPFAWLQIKSRN